MRCTGLIWVWVLISSSLLGSDQIDGTWKGTFNGQPLPVKVRGGYPETVTPFEMLLMTQGNKLSGMFRNLSQQPVKSRPILKGTKWGLSSFSFEVFDNDKIFTWCVTVMGKKMTGTRNKGHMSPLRIGTGARLFSIEGLRQEDKNQELK